MLWDTGNDRIGETHKGEKRGGEQTKTNKRKPSGAKLWKTLKSDKIMCRKVGKIEQGFSNATTTKA